MAHACHCRVANAAVHHIYNNHAKKRKEKFTLFSNHKGGLLRRQPGATNYAPVLYDRYCAIVIVAHTALVHGDSAEKWSLTGLQQCCTASYWWMKSLSHTFLCSWLLVCRPCFLNYTTRNAQQRQLDTWVPQADIVARNCFWSLAIQHREPYGVPLIDLTSHSPQTCFQECRRTCTHESGAPNRCGPVQSAIPQQFSRGEHRKVVMTDTSSLVIPEMKRFGWLTSTST